MNTQTIDQSNRARTTELASDLGARLLRVAWMAIALGLTMGVLLVSGLGDFLGLKDFVARAMKSASCRS